MIVNIFNKTTGRRTHRGEETDRKIAALIRAGHIAVAGPDDPFVKYDFVSGTVVPDVDRRQGEEQRRTDRKQSVVRRNEIQAELASLAGSHTPDDINTQIDLLNEFARLS